MLILLIALFSEESIVLVEFCTEMRKCFRKYNCPTGFSQAHFDISLL